MAALVVKKADETTNITYDALTGAAGDGSKAVWRQDTGAAAGMPVGHRATIEMRTMENGPRTARRFQIDIKRPYSTQNSVTTKYEASDSVVINISGVIPKAIPASEINEAVAQAMNIAAATLIKDALKAGYSPQ
jgi:hypothetical protein